MKIYLVGGAVRDKLLGKDVKDHDYVVVGATVNDLLTQGYKQVGADFPVFLHPETGDEYALARTERKSGSGYHGFTCDFSPSITLEEDLERRDLTINAMALDDNGQLVDPFNGQEDLNNKVFRHVGEAFREDPLRVLRVARFMARHAHEGWQVAPTTMDLMTDISQSGELRSLIPERIWKELSRALTEPTPSAFVSTLRECGALKDILPEVDQLFGVPQPEGHHPEIDAGIHTLMVMDQSAKLSDRLEVRFGSMVHDLGKGITPAEMLPRHINHEKEGVPLVEKLCNRLKTPSSIKKAGMIASEYHLKVHRAKDMKATSLVKMFNELSYRNKPEILEDLILTSEADARGRKGLEDRPYPQSEYLRSLAKASLNVDTKGIAAMRKGDGQKIKEDIYKASVSSVKVKMRELRFPRNENSMKP